MNTLDPNQAAATFADALQQGSPLHAQALGQLNELQQARSAALAVERGRTALRYGAESAPARASVARIAAHAISASAVAAELRRARAAAPQASAHAAIVYGFVLDAAGAAQVDVSILAIGDTERELAHTTTDAAGAFQLAAPVPAATVDKTPALAAQSFKLTIGGGKTATYRYDETFALTAGTLSYREIVLPAPAT